MLKLEQSEVYRFPRLVLLLFIQVLFSLTTVDSATNCLLLIMLMLFVELSVFPLRRSQGSAMFRVMAETSGNFGPNQMCVCSQRYSGLASVAFQRTSSQTKKARLKTVQKYHCCMFNPKQFN